MLFSVISFSALALGDAGNVFEIQAIGENEFSLTFKLNATDFTSEAASFVDPDVIYIDRSEEGLAPAFARTIEVEIGRYVELDGVTVEKETVPFPNDVLWSHTEEEPVVLHLARMGRRVFVRVEVRPLWPSLDEDDLIVSRLIEAVFSISETVPERKVESRQVLGDLAMSPLESSSPGCRSCPPVVPLGVSAGTGQPGDFASHRSVTNDVAWKIKISAAGLYRITGAEMAAAGIPATFRTASQLRLASRDQKVPMWASTPGTLGADDWVMFYGAAAQSAFSTQNVYWLSIGDASGPPVQLDATPSYTEAVVTSSWARVDYAPKNIYSASHNSRIDDYDHWFAMEVAGGSTANIAFATPHPMSSGQAYLSYKLHGANATLDANPDHRSVLGVGGSFAEPHDFNGLVCVTDTVSFPAASVSHGVTLVSVEQQVPDGVPSSPYSNAYIEWLSLCYRRRLVAEALPFFFSGPATPGTVRVAGLPSAAFWLLDVSAPLQPKEMVNVALVADGASWRIDFEDRRGGEQCFALFDEDSVQSVLSIECVRFRNLADVYRQADYLVVTPDVFREPVYRLLEHRYKNGLSVQVATPDDIYNEFSYGMIDPVGIRQYFGTAYHHYQKDAPGYALLVGTGSYDPLHAISSKGTNYIPVRLGAAPSLRTAHEQWYATVDGDDLLPDIALGRIPASTITDVAHVVDKLVAFETAATDAWWHKTALLVADKNDTTGDFQTFSETNTRIHLEVGGFDPVFGIQTAYLDKMSEVMVKQIIQATLDDGVHFLNFMGHGGLKQWSKDSIWHIDDAVALKNTLPPIVTVFTCNNGLFFDPKYTSLVQAMLLNAHGASGMVAPTALSTQIFIEKLADGFYKALAEDRVHRLGDAMEAGFLRLWKHNPNVAELRFYTIFGDPAQHMWGGAQP